MINQIGYALALLLIINYIVYIIYRIQQGYWELRYDLPMELCNWSAIVTSLALITHNRTQAELSYFWVMSGSIQGVITPDLSTGFPHLYFFIFFIAHSGLVAATMFLVFGLKFYPRKGSVLRAILWIEIYFITTFAVNLALKANYGYLMGKPQNGSALDYLGEWPYYLIAMQIIGLSAFVLLYLPFFILNKKNL